MEDEGLRNISPTAAGTQVVDEQKQHQHESNTGRGINSTDQEHHHQTAHDAKCTGVPGEVSKGRPYESMESMKC